MTMITWLMLLFSYHTLVLSLLVSFLPFHWFSFPICSVDGFSSRFLFVCTKELPMLLTLTRIYIYQLTNQQLNIICQLLSIGFLIRTFRKCLLSFSVLLVSSFTRISLVTIDGVVVLVVVVVVVFFLSPNHSNGKLNSPAMCQKRNGLLSSSSLPATISVYMRNAISV